ncbi:ATP-binding cassette domain-containing protein [Paraclostridium bifermentans]|nr:ATP-binding cassette domain-containing protein [Paraclostridium bifermentans]
MDLLKTSISLINQIKSVSLIGKKVEDILNVNNESEESEEIKSFRDCIDIKDLNFSYTKERNALKNINLKFERNKKYAIVGESGCGKSTLIKLIMRYYNEYEGKITIDNKDLNKIYSSDLYKTISMIQQNVFMFDDSIKENIRLFSNYSDESVIESCKRSGIMGLINRLEDGIDSISWRKWE